ncbi:alpha-ribazole phosphatase family protein [Porphyromonas levii]|uniref:alpha-ribazole phosphatase family protein n=2 Tax=Porphyromonas levii TaxID=28114 RepID=UPI0020125EC6|nr:alpha-ribazole phosphatase family protein [Porphyromonas levii]
MGNGMKELWVVRHTAVDVPEGVCYGGTDVGLKESFPEEAAVVAQNLKGYIPDVILTSPLSRAIRLAKAVGYEGAPIDTRLREQHFGDWEMQRYDEITDPQMQLWYEDYIHVVPTNGESFAQLVERLGGFVEELRSSEHKRFLAFAHGGVQMAIGAYLGLYEMIDAPKYIQGYGSIVKYQL